MSPLRWDVLLVGLVLSLPVLALGLRGDLTAEEVAIRALWCLAAGWGGVSVLRLASTPRSTQDKASLDEEPDPVRPDSQHSPAI
jgi:hypothetical protein